MRLVVTDERECLVNLHHRHLKLSEGLVRLTNLFCDRWLTSSGKIEIDDFVREARELVAEAKVVFARFGRGEIEGVVLLPLFLVDDTFSGPKESHIHIKIPTSRDLHIGGRL